MRIRRNTLDLCFDYWRKKGLVKFKELDDSHAQAMKVASAPEEWRLRGKKVVFIIDHYIHYAFTVMN